MRLSAKTEYAALAAVELARRVDARAPVRIRELAERSRVEPATVAKVLKLLAQAELVASFRGAAGGYRLAKPPAEVTYADIRAAVDGPGEDAAPVTVQLAKQSRTAGVLVAAWDSVAEAEAKALAEITLASLAARCRPTGDEMYYI